MRPTLAAVAAVMCSSQDACFLLKRVEAFSKARSPPSRSLRCCTMRMGNRGTANETERKRGLLSPFRRRKETIVDRPGSELFPPKGSSYVPSGMSREEYEQIKKQEAEVQSKMNYGAWGPRFLPSTQRPDGDWMVIPSLWTGGYDANDQTSQQRRGVPISPASTNAAPTPVTTPPNREDGLLRILSYYFQPFFSAYVALSLFVNAATITRLLSSDGVWNALRATLASPPPAQRTMQVTYQVLLRVFALRRGQRLWQLILPVWTHSLVSRLALAAFLAYPLDRILMRPLSERREWARNRTTWALCSRFIITSGLWIALMVQISSTRTPTMAAFWASVRSLLPI